MSPNAPSATQKESASASAPAPAPAPKLRAELPVDFAAFISTSVVMAPTYIESADAAEQLPVLFWLCEAVSPRTIVDIGATDATVYFGLCQAADELSLDTACYLGGVSLDPDVEKSRAQLAQWVEHQNDHHGNRSQIIGGNHDNVAGMLNKGSVDLLVLHAEGASADQMRQWKADLLPKLSMHSVVVIDGLGNGSNELFDALAAMGPSFRFHHGTGFGVVAPTSSPPELVRYLGAQAKDKENATAVSSLFQRLGMGCRQAADQARFEQVRGQLRSTMDEVSSSREELGLRAARLVGRESEILELRERLDWHREEFEEVRRKLLGSQAQVRTLQEANEHAQGQLQHNRESLIQKEQIEKQLQIDFEETRNQLRERRRRIKTLRDANEQLKTHLKKARRSLARSEAIRNKERQEAQARCNELEAIYRSRSWKITAPLRQLIRRLQGR